MRGKEPPVSPGTFLASTPRRATVDPTVEARGIADVLKAEASTTANGAEPSPSQSTPSILLSPAPAKTFDGKPVTPFHVRRVHFKVDETGACEMVVDTKSGRLDEDDESGEPMKMASLLDADVRRVDADSYRIVYSFDSVGNTSDFARSGTDTPRILSGVSIDRTAGLLVLTPIVKKDSESADVSFPRALRLPVSFTIDFDHLVKYSVFFNLYTQKGLIHLGVSPGHPGWHDGSKVFAHWLPDDEKSLGTKRVILFERRFAPESVSEYGFRVPFKPDPAENRCNFSVVRHGHDPVGIQRMSVEGGVVPSFGAAWKLDKGALVVRNVIKGSPFKRSELKIGDEFVSMDGVKPTSTKDLITRLTQARIGTDVKFIVKSVGKEKIVVVKVIERTCKRSRKYYFIRWRKAPAGSASGDGRSCT
jgi:hypothetical protein